MSARARRTGAISARARRTGTRGCHSVFVAMLCCLASLATVEAADDASRLRGIVNRSFGVIEVDTCRDAVRLYDAARFARGQRVVLYQSLGSNRRPLWTAVDTTAAGWVYLATSLQTTLDLSMAVQLVSVASARNATVDDTVTCAPWDGVCGGVIAIECADTLFINNFIDASASGFRGGFPGAARADLSSGDSIAHPSLNQSGEGVERLSARKRVDKSMVSQGGGRGGARNGGGGGGGGASQGGIGGRQCSAFASGYVGGHAGQAVAIDDIEVEAVFGGGGGAGQQNDHADSRGGNGGGIVLLRARIVVADTTSGVSACGEPGRSTHDDGGGGGGAGGTFVLDADTLIGRLRVDVRGGEGGNTSGRLYCYGAGGSGSGGRIVLTSEVLQVAVPALIARMDGGTIGHAVSTDTCALMHDGSEGGAGEIVMRAYPPELKHDRNAPIASAVKSPICAGELARIVIGADTLTTQPLHATSWIKIKMQSADGCAYTDSVQVRVRRIENLALKADTTIASGDSIVLSVPTIYHQVMWSNGEREYRFVIRDSGYYWVSAIDTSGCMLRSDTMHVLVASRRPRIYVSVGDASGRPGDNVQVVVRAFTDDTLTTPIRVTGVLSSQMSLLVPGTRDYSRSRKLSFVPVALTFGEAGVVGAGAATCSQTLLYRCALGDADTSELVLDSVRAYGLDSVRAYGADVIVERRGIFRLVGVCRAGGMTRLFDPWGGAVSVERVDDVTLRVNSSARVVGVFDVLGKRLDFVSKSESAVGVDRVDNAVLITFATAPAREIYISLMAEGVVRTMVLWMR